MTPRYLVLLFTSCLALVSSISAVEISNREGRTIHVEILRIESDRIEIRMANGGTTWFDRAQLSDKSQALIAEKEAAEQNLYKELNELLGIPLFADNHLWDDTDEATAKRIKWPRESRTDTQSSFRIYPRSNDRILDSRPYSAVLYGSGGKTDNISIVFANKGDFRFSPQPTDREIKAMEDAIRYDVRRIKELLTESLGEVERQQYGSGRGMRQLIQRWDWKDHAFLLASQDGEYVSLKITDLETADNRGRATKISDEKLRQQSKANIATKENGDVLISNIPMVNQGPKGYCVPATFERYLRYMNIPADMYILAMAGQTSIGGGTSISQIISAIEGYATSQNRSLKQIQTDVGVRNIKKYVDQGLPIMWIMHSTKEYNTFVNEYTKARRGATDWNAWKKVIRESVRKTNLNPNFSAPHICMIIGYNRDTDEIAVSDSWGPSYELRWVPADHANQVSMGSIYLIDF